MQPPTTVRVDHLFRSQFGEDRILWQVFRHKPVGFFIEVGAYDGVTLSNTYFLEQMGWCGILVEPIEELCRRAAEARPRSRIIHAAASKRGSCGTRTFTIARNVPVLSFLTADEAHRQRCLREGAEFVEVQVPVITLDDILMHGRAQAGGSAGPWVPQRGWQIDLVSIDVEGAELDVLDGFQLERFQPSVLVLENDQHSGAGMEPYLAQRGYRKFHRQQINDFYVRESVADGLVLGPFS